MKHKLSKTLTSLAMAAVLVCSNVTAAAAEAVNAELSDTLSFEGCAANIRSIYKARYPEQTDIVDAVVDALTADEVFIGIFESQGASAFQIVEDSLHDALDPYTAPAAYDESFYYSDYYVPTIQQKEDNYCGVASIIMAVMGGGKKFPDTSPEGIDKLQDEIARETGIYNKPDKGVVTGDMAAYLQKYFPANSMNCTYRAKAFTRLEDSFKHIDSYLQFAFMCNTLPIIRVEEPRRLSYYPNNYSGAHYIVISSIDFETGEVWVVDPHYDNRYFGRHLITLDEIKDLVNSSNSDLWMCVFTNTSDEPYIYT